MVVVVVLSFAHVVTVTAFFFIRSLCFCSFHYFHRPLEALISARRSGFTASFVWCFQFNVAVIFFFISCKAWKYLLSCLHTPHRVTRLSTYIMRNIKTKKFLPIKYARFDGSFDSFKPDMFLLGASACLCLPVFPVLFWLSRLPSCCRHFHLLLERLCWSVPASFIVSIFLFWVLPFVHDWECILTAKFFV